MTGEEARDDEREAALRTIESLHPAARIALGSSTHGGPTQYGEGCGLHGAWCRDWQRTRKAVETLREGYRKHPEPEITDEMVDRAASSIHEWALPDVPPGLETLIARAALEAALRVPVGEGDVSR